MKRIALAVSVLALLGIIVPPCLFFSSQLELGTTKQWMLAATVVWFVSTPLWMEHQAT